MNRDTVFAASGNRISRDAHPALNNINGLEVEQGRLCQSFAILGNFEALAVFPDMAAKAIRQQIFDNHQLFLSLSVNFDSKEKSENIVPKPKSENSLEIRNKNFRKLFILISSERKKDA
jgi:hypothetical protein